jgi:hypothetical protein
MSQRIERGDINLQSVRQSKDVFIGGRDLTLLDLGNGRECRVGPHTGFLQRKAGLLPESPDARTEALVSLPVGPLRRARDSGYILYPALRPL